MCSRSNLKRICMKSMEYSIETTHRNSICQNPFDLGSINGGKIRKPR